MLSTEIIDMPVSSTLNKQGMHYNNKNYAADLQKFSKKPGKLKPGSVLRMNLFRRSIRLGRYLSTIKAQLESFTCGNYVEFFRQIRLSSEKSDRANESPVAVSREAIDSITNHIGRLQAEQEKLKTFIRDSEKLNVEELKNQFDKIRREIQVIVVQIKKYGRFKRDNFLY